MENELKIWRSVLNALVLHRSKLWHVWLYKPQMVRFTAVVHGRLARINAQKTCFCGLSELGALSHFNLHIEKQKKE